MAGPSNFTSEMTEQTEADEAEMGTHNQHAMATKDSTFCHDGIHKLTCGHSVISDDLNAPCGCTCSNVQEARGLHAAYIAQSFEGLFCDPCATMGMTLARFLAIRLSDHHRIIEYNHHQMTRQGFQTWLEEGMKLENKMKKEWHSLRELTIAGSRPARIVVQEVDSFRYESCEELFLAAALEGLGLDNTSSAPPVPDEDLVTAAFDRLVIQRRD